MEYCLIADVGATNCRLFLWELDRGDIYKRTCIHQARYLTKDFKSIDQAFDKFLAEEQCQQISISYCSVAIAGAVKNNATTAKFANFDWEPVDGSALAKKYKLKACNLLNDFEAVGYSFMTDSFKDSMIRLQSATSKPSPESSSEPDPKNDRMLVLGFGTGLGVVSMVGVSKKETFRVLPSEGGHVGLAPSSSEEWEALQYVAKHLDIKENEMFSQEHIFCGRGIPHFYNYLLFKTENKVAESLLTAKEVFDIIEQKEHEKLKEQFFSLLFSFFGRSFDHLCKLFLPTGGKLIIGGTIYQLFSKHFNSDKEKFMEALAPTFYNDPEFEATLRQSIDMLLYTNSTDDFVVEGAINHLYAWELTAGKAKQKRSSLKDNYMKPITSNSITEKAKEKISQADDEKQKELRMEKRVSFDMPIHAKTFEDFYHSNLLKANVLTFTGYLNLRAVKNKLFIGKIISDPVEKFYRRRAACQEFRGYRLRLLDAEVQLIIPINVPRLFKNDIVLLNNKDTLYYSNDNGWYFQTFDNTLTDITVSIFDTLCEKYIGSTALVDLDKISSKIKADFRPSQTMIPKPETDLSHLLFQKPNGMVQSKVIMMKVVENLGTVAYRRNKDAVEEFTKVRIQSHVYTLDVHIPTWTNVPQMPFYGYFLRETYFAPGHIPTPLFILDEYTIFDRSPIFDEQFTLPVEKHVPTNLIPVPASNHKEPHSKPQN